jgi:glutathione S-transferase
MTYDLVIGDRAYSSWSLRGWLLFDAFGIPVKTHSARLYTDELATTLRDYFPAKTAPTMRTPEGSVVPETIAIAEELATRHLQAGLWPADPKARATARVLAAEMHAGFGPLRSHCAYTVAFDGVEARLVEVQCSVTPGLPGFAIVGLPDKAVSEARERVARRFGALSIALPSKRITVNLSPADLPKEGSHFDLPIALAVLAALE